MTMPCPCPATELLQLAVSLLDPQHELIPKSEFPVRVISGEAETLLVTWVVNTRALQGA